MEFVVLTDYFTLFLNNIFKITGAIFKSIELLFRNACSVQGHAVDQCKTKVLETWCECSYIVLLVKGKICQLISKINTFCV